MIEFLYQIGQMVGGAVVLVAAAGWLASKLLENRLNRGLESHKTRLQAQSDAEIESLKTRLQINAKEREISATWLHQKRADAIETLYPSLVDLQHSVRIVLDIFSPRNPAEIRKYTTEASRQQQDVYRRYLKAKIFLSSNTCVIVEKTLNGIQDPVSTYEAYLSVYDDDELKTLIDVKERAWNEIQENVQPALRELEADFRRILGVQHGEPVALT